MGTGELTVLAVLMLRGAQTPGELKARGDRLHHFEDLRAVHAILERLIERGHVRVLERRPGQKEERYAQTLGDVGAEDSAASAPEGAWPASPPEPARQSSDETAARLDRLEQEVASLRSALGSLERELGTSP